jgi:hypothetical protein
MNPFPNRWECGGCGGVWENYTEAAQCCTQAKAVDRFLNGVFAAGGSFCLTKVGDCPLHESCHECRKSKLPDLLDKLGLVLIIKEG